MRPENTEAQALRRKNAVWGAVSSTAVRVVAALVLLWLRAGLDPAGLTAKLLALLIVFEVGTILPIWINLKTRLKEIQGGEEDAAAQY